MQVFKPLLLSNGPQILLSGRFVHEDHLTELFVYSKFIKYGSHIAQVNKKTKFNLVHQGVYIILNFYIPDEKITFMTENYNNEYDFKHWENSLLKVMNYKIDDLKQIYKPIRKMNDYSTNLYSYLLAQSLQNGSKVMVKGILKRVLDECIEAKREIQIQIFLLRNGKYNSVQYIGIYETLNTIYVIYSTNNGKPINLQQLSS